jgi:hypothetical protein
LIPTDHFASDEAQRDPAASGNDSPQNPSANEGENLSLSEQEVEEARRLGTGRQRIRSTGTEKKPLQPIAEGVEHNTQSLKKKEPDDSLPDQLDRNK